LTLLHPEEIQSDKKNDCKTTKLIKTFTALQNRLFARLYFAQTISLLGDAFT